MGIRHLSKSAHHVVATKKLPYPIFNGIATGTSGHRRVRSTGDGIRHGVTRKLSY
jgi:hypothetical protein